nr:hypothetical protein [Nannocystis sp.]
MLVGSKAKPSAVYSQVCQLARALAPWAMALLAWKPVLYMANNTQGSSATTTVIIIRLRSMASRTCDDAFVTSFGVYRKVSVAS